LTAGDELFVGQITPPLGDHLDEGMTRGSRDAHPKEEVTTVRVVPGPHVEWFEPDALERLATTIFALEPQSNRVGLRLRTSEGPLPSLRVASVAGRELQSLGMVHGAMQVPPDGAPIILMPDHATHGGYPVLAVVASVDLGRLGQLAPGQLVRFEPIDLARAGQEAVVRQRVLESAVVGHYPLVAG
jgi:allophanate hydrolase subunit 2